MRWTVSKVFFAEKETLSPHLCLAHGGRDAKGYQGVSTDTGTRHT